MSCTLGYATHVCPHLAAGKTLAFLLPVVEALYRRRWSKLDGLGALVISPTRELALQVQPFVQLGVQP